jgi:cytochrome c oxidase subunit III
MITDTHAIAQQQPPISNARLAMMLFVASEAMLFAGLVAGYVVLEHGSDGFAGMPSATIGLAPLALAVLVASSAALVAAQRSVRDGAPSASRWSMLALVLGTVFLGVQGIEWVRLLGKGMLPGTSVNTGMLYVVGGVHGVHVVGGLVFLAVLAARALRAPGSERTRTFATTAALYWHFVTIVWVTLFLMLYIL